MKSDRYKNRPKATKYNGTLFKSRLEATWAEWFDKQGIIWQYEKFKVQIDTFRHYTPDFALYLVSPPVFIEVKPTWEMVTDDTRIQRLSSVTSNLCIGICGDPGPLGSEHRAYYFEDGEVCAVWGSHFRTAYSFPDWVRMLQNGRLDGR